MEIRRIELPVRGDARGSLAFCESGKHVPFETRRTYWLYGMSGDGKTRGDHAHRATVQAAFCLAGSLTMTFDDGKEKAEVRLDSASVGVLIPAMAWHAMKDITPDCVLLVLASLPYDEADYVRNYDDYLRLVTQ